MASPASVTMRLPVTLRVVRLRRCKDLPDYGWVRFRKADKAEPHSWQPQTVRSLQTVVGTARSAAAVAEPGQAWAAFASIAVEKEPTVLRDLLEFRPAGGSAGS